jgi:4-amino-4-deoxy-L-arabinose transferase-like glycosyltransferase
MSIAPALDQQGKPGHSWWREREFFLMLALVLGAYFFRAGSLPIRGEEPRWAQVAFEMLYWGDGVVPREQGDPFLSRPPLHSWLIAGSSLLFGQRGVWVVRLPSLLAMVLTAVLIYAYGRTFLSRLGALASAVAFATLGEMFQTGRQAETEPVFILLLSASLLVWHVGMVRNYPPLVPWLAGSILMALASLAKGPQAAVYFFGFTSLYLVLTGQWRRLLHGASLLGAVVAALLIGLWLVPFYEDQGWQGVRAVWMGDTAVRFKDWKLTEVALHLLSYPFEVLGSTAPWSLLLLFYLAREGRRSIGTARPQVFFLTLCLVLAFLTCWIPPGGQTRYFSPLYPCMALLIGLAIQRCTEASATSSLRTFWHEFLVLAGCVMIGAGMVAIVALFLNHHPRVGPWALAPLPALAYALVCFVLGRLVLRACNQTGPAGEGTTRARAAVLGLGAFMAISFSGTLTELRIRRSEHQDVAVARLKEKLPPGQRLVSFNHVDALFAYHYGLPIISQGWPKDPHDGTELSWFCFDCPGGARPPFPFAWEEVAAISMDRYRHQGPPERVVVVGHRLP